MLSVAAGLVVASALWRLPYIQRLERDEDGDGASTIAGEPLPEPTHGRRPPSRRTPPPPPAEPGEEPTEVL